MGRIKAGSQTFNWFKLVMPGQPVRFFMPQMQNCNLMVLNHEHFLISYYVS